MRLFIIIEAHAITEIQDGSFRECAYTRTAKAELTAGMGSFNLGDDIS
ncbi:hypothetical protein [uncultured Acidaminococcus sp.]|jgi:hypothetical protein|nr:hypothetical protein [uncultured Acidaminococcus sp.]